MIIKKNYLEIINPRNKTLIIKNHIKSFSIDYDKKTLFIINKNDRSIEVKDDINILEDYYLKLKKWFDDYYYENGKKGFWKRLFE